MTLPCISLLKKKKNNFIAMGVLLPSSITMDPGRFSTPQLVGALGAVALVWALIVLLTQQLSGAVRVPVPLSDEISDPIRRKQMYSSSPRTILDKYYKKVWNMAKF